MSVETAYGGGPPPASVAAGGSCQDSSAPLGSVRCRKCLANSSNSGYRVGPCPANRLPILPSSASRPRSARWFDSASRKSRVGQIPKTCHLLSGPSRLPSCVAPLVAPTVNVFVVLVMNLFTTQSDGKDNAAATTANAPASIAAARHV